MLLKLLYLCYDARLLVFHWVLLNRLHLWEVEDVWENTGTLKKHLLHAQTPFLFVVASFFVVDIIIDFITFFAACLFFTYKRWLENIDERRLFLFLGRGVFLDFWLSISFAVFIVLFDLLFRIWLDIGDCKGLWFVDLIACMLSRWRLHFRLKLRWIISHLGVIIFHRDHY